MEADWEIEIGEDAPVIDANWSGFIDLRVTPELVNEVSECAGFTALRQTLLILNGAQSAVWTSKCDLWVVEDFAQFDRDEFEAAESDSQAVTCYIDILPRERNAWKKAESAIQYCSEFVEQLKTVTVKAARVELVLRRAVYADGEEETGITAYVTGCGESDEAARVRLGDALDALTQTLAGRT
jgi:hypothetical protein